MDSHTCEFCGQSIPAESGFCSECGAPFHLVCRFCEHNNPAASKFCNKCGGQLNLLPCPGCGAVTDITAKSCYQCHRPLWARGSEVKEPGFEAEERRPLLRREESPRIDEATALAMIEQFYEQDQQQEPGADPLDPWSSTGDVDRPYDRVPPSFAATVDQRYPRDRAPTTDARAWVSRRERAWRIRRGTLVIVGAAVLATIGLSYYYNHRQRSLDLGYAPHRLAVNNEQDSRDSSPGDGLRDMAPLGTSPARDIQSARNEKNTAVWDTEKFNNFSNGAKYQNIAPLAKPAADTPETAAAPAPEPAAAATAETKTSARAPTKSAAALASPPRSETTTAPISWYEVEAAPATAAVIVSFAIAPWGEIYVNGERRGVSPPLRELGLSPGQYKIEVRNTTFPAYVRIINVEAGAQIRIKHHFP